VFSVNFSEALQLVTKAPSVKIKVNFVIGQVTEDDFAVLKGGEKVTCKMIITESDYQLFNYEINDAIQAETNDGDRLWCRIVQLDKIEESQQVLLIFTLMKRD
jgi:hypothetical protein